MHGVGLCSANGKNLQIDCLYFYAEGVCFIGSKSAQKYLGKTIGYLTVKKECGKVIHKGKPCYCFECFCSACGNTVIKSVKELTLAKYHADVEGKNPSCGCMKYSGFSKHANDTEIDLIGRQFCMLTVEDKGHVIFTGKDNKKRRTWKCRCECGQYTYVTTGDLLSGNTKSCGCLISVGQKQIAQLLTEWNIPFVGEYSFPDLVSSKGNPLRFDFAIFCNNSLQFLLEYQGAQHYVDGSYFGWTQRHITDPQKRLYCQTNGIKLYEITYQEDIKTKLQNILQSIHDDTVPSPDCSGKV